MADDRVVLDVRNLSQAYGGSRILRDVSLQADKGALVALLENHQNADGSVRVPKALAPYLGGIEVLAP